MYFVNISPRCVVVPTVFQILIPFPQVLLHVLFEHASGYALFAVKEVEEIGMLLPQVRPFLSFGLLPLWPKWPHWVRR